jgi:hypothetical protein
MAGWNVVSSLGPSDESRLEPRPELFRRYGFEWMKTQLPVRNLYPIAYAVCREPFGCDSRVLRKMPQLGQLCE